ncbi:MAG: TAT-variant-translocated molybdopterin oxidoreductase [candidate division Zixibacteria bacterium]|nr:TAT-variant-translocated molybdopterin oxidoreductase [candidate division Zixibacteria bacterium]
MSSLRAQENKQFYWRSLDELANTPEFQRWAQDEFPGGATEPDGGVSRRKFMQLMGASLALAWMAGCRWPKEEILPFARNPEGFIPGKTKQFATSSELGGVGRGLLVTSFDGRPIKIEGNPLHPGSLGACDAINQASLLEMYDPDRSKILVRREHGQELTQSWDDFAGFARSHFAGLRAAGGAGLFILAEESNSPSLLDMRGRLLSAFPKAQWLAYEPISRDNERAGAHLAFGKPLRTNYAFDRAEAIVSFDSDFLLTHPESVRYARDFASGRRAEDGKMNRLFSIESVLSLTGAAADHRVGLRASEIPAAVCRLAAELYSQAGGSLPLPGSGLEAALQQFRSSTSSSAITPFMARDLLAHRGKSIVTVGPRQPAVVHAVAHLINTILGNVGSTVTYIDEPDAMCKPDAESIRPLTDEARAGRVQTLVILGGNPAYNAPTDVNFAEALSKVGTSIHLGLYDDETSQLCQWHLPRAHYLESWGDTRAWDGTISPIQPLIQPLYGGKSPIELLAMVTGDQMTNGYDIVRRTLQPLTSGLDFEVAWRRLLHDGVMNGSASPPVMPQLSAQPISDELGRLASTTPSASEDLELVFTPDTKVYDGRFANSGWLQEMPDPVTKLTWDNAALIAPATARKLGVSHGDVVRIGAGGKSLEAPAYVLPGHPAGTIALALGYGRKFSGSVGNGVGVNAYALRNSATPHLASGVKITRTGATIELACTHDHHAIDAVGIKEIQSRIPELVREAELSTFISNPDFVREGVHHPPLVSLWTEHDYNGHRWAMAIDLSSCIGCGSCMVACQAENNIPIVGKANVIRGREMHWIRVDRYFSGDPEHPSVLFQPVACHHCENAPCEQVCPVAATTHDAEGLNVMVYNRCVGTRYCSNNCPYKVRRFNFFNYHKDTPEVAKMMYNPDVTVRSRGVMEKCTYCIQRIESVKITAKNDRRPITDGEIIPACAQTCPSQAIVFGDLNDKTSRVAKLHEHHRSYAMLEELNVKPRTKYLAKLRNRSEELRDRTFDKA